MDGIYVLLTKCVLTDFTHVSLGLPGSLILGHNGQEATCVDHTNETLGGF